MDLKLSAELLLELQTQWDRIPKTYDWTPVEKKVIFSAAENLIGDLKGKDALDLGCGKGAFTKFLSGRLGANTLGIDRNDKMLEFANAVADRETNFQKLDIAQIDSLGSNRFDVISAAFVLEHLDESVDIEKMYDCIYALLKPGGRFIAVLPHPCFEHLHNTDDTKRIPQQDKVSYFDEYLIEINLTTVLGEISTFTQRHRPLSWFLNNILKSPLSTTLSRELGLEGEFPYYIMLMAEKGREGGAHG